MDIAPSSRRSRRSREEDVENNDDSPQPRKLMSPDLRPAWLEHQHEEEEKNTRDILEVIRGQADCYRNAHQRKRVYQQ